MKISVHRGNVYLDDIPPYTLSKSHLDVILVTDGDFIYGNTNKPTYTESEINNMNIVDLVICNDVFKYYKKHLINNYHGE